jgi:ribosomal protein S18 acetylase RimI-like enzyme
MEKNLMRNPAKVKLRIADNMWELWYIAVPKEYQGQGWGRKALESVCKKADGARVSLVIFAEAQSIDRGLSQDELVSWYRRHGFKTKHGEGWWGKYNMVRQPK